MSRRSIPCPWCPRLFANQEALRRHVAVKRRFSAKHGMDDDWRPRSRDEIKKVLNAEEEENAR